MSRDLLFEIGCEEIPSVPLYDALTELKERAVVALDDARLGYGEVRVYGSPRRLALFVENLAERQTDLALVVRGPAARVAFDESGAPTKAAEGFARSRGVRVEDLSVGEADGGRYVFASVNERGKDATEVLPGLLSQLAANFDWAKSMRWGSGTVRFIRPVRWLVALYGATVVPVSFAGLAAGNVSHGHRFLSGPVEVPYAGAYVETLRAARVLVDPEERAEAVMRGIDEAAAACGARAVVPEKTLAEVVNLVEWPTAAVGRFDEEFLGVPREVVEEAMESHQRYFPVESSDGVLLPNFIVVHNGDPARTAEIVAGHERVIRARLADASFFYREDLSQPLEAYVARLDAIVFHEKLGSLGAKAARMESLAEELARAVGAPAAEAAHAVRAAHLAKADLVTHVVVEFPTLQGVMGYHYALASGEAQEVAEAIVDHYRPRFAGDDLPRSLAGMLVSVAEKLDTIVGIIAIGQAPTGSADPYALRRYAIGILTMILDGGLRLDLDRAIAQALARYEGALAPELLDGAAAAVKAFFDGRLSVMLKDRGYAYDEVDAVMAVASGDPQDTLRRVRALAAFRSSDAGRDLSVAFKRAANLADPAAGTECDAALMGPVEADLLRALETARERVVPLLGVAHDYEGALAALADLRGPVDAFFDGVLVMDADERLRRNRLALLNGLVGLFEGFADFRKLAG